MKKRRRIKRQQSFRHLKLERLERRLVLASRLNDFTVVYQDMDGDDVTVLASLPVFTPANVATVFKFSQGSVNGDNNLPQQLQRLEFAGFPSHALDGLSITASSNQQSGGDGRINVG
jgi:hypothetical protein